MVEKKETRVASRDVYQPEGNAFSPDKPPANPPRLISSVNRNGAAKQPPCRKTSKGISPSFLFREFVVREMPRRLPCPPWAAGLRP